MADFSGVRTGALQFPVAARAGGERRPQIKRTSGNKTSDPVHRVTNAQNIHIWTVSVVTGRQTISAHKTAARRAVIKSAPHCSQVRPRPSSPAPRRYVYASPALGVNACPCRWWCEFHHAACAQIDSVRCLRPGTGWPRPRANRRIGRRNDPTGENSSSGGWVLDRRG